MKDHIHVEWWLENAPDRKVQPEDQEQIDDHLWSHLPEQIKQGYVEGHLFLEVGKRIYRGIWRFVRVH